ncbi:hypothetical protein [Nocardia otitidiscaviarum]|uniref:hypothetical protein n=1 Tax=Nocardia otitidiscaviarum TaxID=1823 RepID=UPI0018934717|nr:hypothetical protein [Nocardia otitidiscaviarum]MBF6182132.1 hypothetical protein [Nocardia otitidiscaviarum]
MNDHDRAPCPAWGEYHLARHALQAHQSCRFADCDHKARAFRALIAAFGVEVAEFTTLLDGALSTEPDPVGRFAATELSAD